MINMAYGIVLLTLLGIGLDFWKASPRLPIQGSKHWWKDGEPTTSWEMFACTACRCQKEDAGDPKSLFRMIRVGFQDPLGDPCPLQHGLASQLIQKNPQVMVVALRLIPKAFSHSKYGLTTHNRSPGNALQDCWTPTHRPIKTMFT